MRSAWLFIVAVTVTLEIYSESQVSAQGPAESKAALIAAGDLTNDTIVYEYGIYFLPLPKDDPVKKFRGLAAKEFADWKVVDRLDEAPDSPTVAALLEKEVAKNYTPPNMEYLQYYGRGLDRAQAEALQSSKSAIRLVFAYPQKNSLSGLKASLRMTHALAEASGGLLWDEATREVFTAAAWKKQRLDSWKEKFPDVSTQITVHAYKDGEHIRAVTLGMEKLGLPDVVIDEFSWALSRNIGHTINLLAQALVEGQTLKKAGEFDLDIRTIQNAQVREPQVKSLKSNAVAIARLTLREGERQDGDPNNGLIAIGFDRAEGPDQHAKQMKTLSELFGSEDSIIGAKHDEDLKAASDEARRKLPALREAFKKGLAPGEFIRLKAPFATPDGEQEYMWVNVTTWDGDKIKGLLANEPFRIPKLKAGQIVEISEHSVFDYIRQRPDGSIEGNSTGELLRKRSEQ